MSASDNLNEQQFSGWYHGTRAELAPGDLITTGHMVTTEHHGDGTAVPCAVRAYPVCVEQRVMMAGIKPGEDEPWEGSDVIEVVSAWLKEHGVNA